jgi:hypothetical protein
MKHARTILDELPDYPIVINEVSKAHIRSISKISINEQLEDAAEGIFYILKKADGTWVLFPYRYDRQDRNRDHVDVWPYAARVVANSYANVAEAVSSDEVKQLAARMLAARKGNVATTGKVEAIYRQIKDSPYAFPRGRVTLVDPGLKTEKYVVRHGSDIGTKISKLEIENAFSINGKCRWSYDEHERCIREDQMHVCGVLGIKPDWSAVV